MTNEEIFKYADNKIFPHEKKFFIKYGLICLIGMCGGLILASSLEYWPLSISAPIAAFLFVAIPVLAILFVKAADKFVYKPRRNYTYNLVRADERKRCMTKMERYEMEGSR